MIRSIFFLIVIIVFIHCNNDKAIQNKNETTLTTKLNVEEIKNKSPQLSYNEKRIIDLMYDEDILFTTISHSSKTLVWDYIKQNYPQFTITTPTNIINTYRENSLKGDNLYKNKPIILFGEVGQVGINSFTDNPYIIFSLNNIFSRARAEFKNWKYETDQISNLHTRENVSLVCQNTDYTFNTIFFLDCEFFRSFIIREIKPKMYKKIYNAMTNPSKENAKHAYLITYFSEQFTSNQLDECFKSEKKCTKKFKTITTKLLNLEKKDYNYIPKRYLELGFTKEMLKEKK